MSYKNEKVNIINSIKKSSILRAILDELNDSNIIDTLTHQCLDYANTIMTPYYVTHLVTQIIIICLLLVILYVLLK